MCPWMSHTLDFWLQFGEKKCSFYMDVYGNNNTTKIIISMKITMTMGEEEGNIKKLEN